MALTCLLCQGKVQKRENCLCLPFCLGESCPPALALVPDTSVPPCIPQLPFKLLPQCQNSEGVSLHKSLHRSFKRNCLGLQKFLPLTQSPNSLVFAARSCGDLHPGTAPLGWGLGVGLGLLVPEISLPNFYPLHVDVEPAHSTSPSLLPVWLDVVSLIPQLSEFHSIQFLMALSDGFSII